MASDHRRDHLGYNADKMMRYDANKKNALIAYILWFFLPMLGLHRCYLGHWMSGLIMLALFGISTALAVIVIGYLGLAIVAVWWAVDALLIPGMTRSYNNQVADDLSR